MDDNIPHHPKFVKAGAMPSWLWVCGNCYCNRYLTDGFIPVEVLSTLGQIPNVKTHADTLVAVGLWEISEGGYRVHDFHDHNPHAATVKAKREQDRERKRAADAKSLPLIPDGIQTESRRNPDGIQTESRRNPEVPARAIPVPSHPSPIPSQELQVKQELARALHTSADADFEAFRQAYPASRRVGGKTGKNAFKTATHGRNGDHFAAMLDALEQQKRSEQWQTPKLIPLMTTWLNQERWNQVLPEPKGYGQTPKTASNANSMIAFIQGKRK